MSIVAMVCATSSPADCLPPYSMTRFVSYRGAGCGSVSGGSGTPCRVGDPIDFTIPLYSQCEWAYWTVDGVGTSPIGVRFQTAGVHEVRVLISSFGWPGTFSWGTSVSIVNSIEIADPIEFHEQAGVANIVIERTRLPGTASVDYATSDGTAYAGTNYTAVSGTLTFAADEYRKTVAVPLINDSEFRPGYFNFTLSNASAGYVERGRTTAKVSIVDDDPPPEVTISFDASGYDLQEADGSLPIEMRISSSSPLLVPFTVDYTAPTTSGWLVQIGSARFEPGETSKTITATVRKEPCYRHKESVLNLQLTSATPYPVAKHETPALRVVDAEARPTLTLSDVAVTEGWESHQVYNLTADGPLCSTIIFPATLTEGTATTGDYTSNGPAAYGLMRMQTEGYSTFKIVGDAWYEPDETFNVEIRAPDDPSALQDLPILSRTKATITILNDDPPPYVLSIRAGDDAAGGGIASFLLWFNVPVRGLDATDFAVREENVSGSSVVGVTDYSEDGYSTVFAIAVRCGNPRTPSGGKVTLCLVDDDSIVDENGTSLGGTGAGNGSVESSSSVTVAFTANAPVGAEALFGLAIALALVAMVVLRRS